MTAYHDEASELRTKAYPQRERFDFAIAWADSYDGVFSRRLTDASTDLAVIADAVRCNGRVMLTADAGAGKSTIAARVALTYCESGGAASILAVRDLRGDPLQRWDELSGAPRERMRFALDRLCETAPPTGRGRESPSSRQPWLVVCDGLNELPGGRALELLEAIEAYARATPWIGFLVTDRLTRRELPSNSWLLATIQGVEHRGNAEAFTNALAHDVLVRHPEVERRTMTGILLADLRAAVNGDEGALLALGTLAYSTRRDQQAPAEAFSKAVGLKQHRRLVSCGMLRPAHNDLAFRHHLYHDVLACHVVARRRDTWVADTFDDLTREANEPENLAFVSEQLNTDDSADFIQRVFDWNLYAASHAASRRLITNGNESSWVEVAIQAVLAERRWDPFVKTVQNVEDALRTFDSAFATALLDADSKGAVHDVVNGLSSNHVEADWLAVFQSSPGETALEALSRPSLIGWTASDVLRRDLVNPELHARLLRMARHAPEPVVRWRAVHVLGAQAVSGSLETALAVLDGDVDVWVRFGAVRAIVELAARGVSQRPQAIAALASRARAILAQPLVCQKLETSLLLVDPPPSWERDIAPLIEELWAAADTVHAQDHWRRVAWGVTAAGRISGRDSSNRARSETDVPRP